MPFDFATTKRVEVPRIKNHPTKSSGEKYNHLFQGPLKPRLPQEQSDGRVYAPIPEQIRLILMSSPRSIRYAPHIRSINKQVQLLGGYYIRLHAFGFQISNVDNFRLKHAKALIDMWHADGCTTSDLCMLWTALLFWTQILGKPEMLDPLEDITLLFKKTNCIHAN